MFALTKKTDYALIALTQLSRSGGRVVSAREIAEGSNVPLPILTNILKTLTHAGIVSSERGSRGGYCLSRSANQICLDELITAIEGPMHLVRCMIVDAADGGHGVEEGLEGPNHCTLEPSCPIRMPAQRVYERFKLFLKSVTLAELGVENSPEIPLRQINIERASVRPHALTEFSP